MLSCFFTTPGPLCKQLLFCQQTEFPIDKREPRAARLQLDSVLPRSPASRRDDYSGPRPSELYNEALRVGSKSVSL